MSALGFKRRIGAGVVAPSQSFAWTANPAPGDGAFGPTLTFTAVPIGAANATRKVVLFVTTNSNGTAGTTVTIGGVTATLLASTLTAFLFVAAVPTGTTADVVIANGGGVAGWVIQAGALINYNATPTSTGTLAYAPQDPATVSPTVGASSIAVGGVVSEGAALSTTASAGTAGLLTQASGIARTMLGATRTTTGNLTFNTTGSNCDVVYAVFGP